jgi:hypothetical protein
MRKEIFEALGRFEDIPLMEDYELVKSVHKLFPPSALSPSRGVFVLTEKVSTSARRWRQKGLVYTTLMNQVLFLSH